MKTLIKLTLVLCLFSSVAIAGDMPSGNRTCPPEGCPPPPCTENCSNGIMNQQGEDGSESISDATAAAIDFAVDFVGNTLTIL